MVLQGRQDELGKGDCPPARASLWFLRDEGAAELGQRSIHGQHAPLEIDVGPLQPKQLALAHAAADRQHVELCIR